MLLHMKDFQWPVLTAADIAKLVGLVKSDPVDVLHNYVQYRSTLQECGATKPCCHQ